MFPKFLRREVFGMEDKDVVEIYETGKHRRYGLLFAVNGGAFAIAKLIAGEGPPRDAVLGGLRLSTLAMGMAVFTLVMTFDIWTFGERMRNQSPELSLFGAVGKGVLLLIGALIAVGWLLVIHPAPT
jgi:hypothetical protein